MSRRCPAAWGALVGSKLQKLCANDPFLRVEVQVSHQFSLVGII